MNRKYNSALFTLVFLTFCSVFTSDVFAQKTDALKSEQPTGQTCSGEKFVMPPSIAVGNDAFENYLKIASLSWQERKDAFRKLSNEQKASFIKVNLALQLVKRPAMTKEQREFVLDAISKVSADIYDKSNPEKVRNSEQAGLELVNKAFGLFPRQEAGDFVEPLNTNKQAETALVQKYNDLLRHGVLARRKIAKEMPVNDRVNIWKVQLAYHLATGKFSKAQNEFILEQLTSLSPETFASRAHLTAEEEAKALEALESRIFSVFTKPEGFAIFMTIGIQKDVANELSVEEQGSCNCRWYCGLTGVCQSGCTHKPDLCGPENEWQCTGRCAYPN